MRARTREIELAKLALQEKAEQLELTSKYKSEFLANMSHELRTPLNSLLILSGMLAENAEGSLTPKQKEFAQTIYAAGSDLLSLINDILDMAKIESGTMAIEVAEYSFAELWEYVDRTFRPMAETKGLALAIDLAASLPKAICTDSRRLQQVLRNLLSNACKFTETGRVEMGVKVAAGGWSADHPVLGRAGGARGVFHQRHRHRHRRRQVEDHLRAVSAGRHGHRPDVRRDGPGAFDQPGDRPPAGWRDPGAKHAGPGEHIHAVPAAGLSAARTIPGPSRRASSAPQATRGATARPRVCRPARQRAVRDRRPHRRLAGHVPQMDVGGDRDDLQPGDRLLLVVEHDPRFASILLEMAHQIGFKGLITSRGEMALELAQSMNPAAITLDLRLPDMAAGRLGGSGPAQAPPEHEPHPGPCDLRR